MFKDSLISNNIVKIDLTDRYLSAFGFLAKNLILRSENFNPYRFDYYEQNPETFDILFKYENKEIKFSSIPFLKNTSIFGFSKTDDSISIVAPPPKIDFKRNKKLKITSLNEDYGEIVERWGTEPYEVKIEGILVDMEKHIYPSSRIEELHQLFSYNGLVEVSGLIFNEKEIRSVFFKSIEINSVDGYDDTIKYVLIARASKEINLKLND